MAISRKKIFDVITLGDATRDMYVELGNEFVIRNGKKKNVKELCVPFGAKLPVVNQTARIGGNAANVAMGCSKMGLSVAFAGALGDDEFGSSIREELSNNKIDVSLVTAQAKSKTNYSTILLHNGERTILSYHPPRKYVPKALPKTKWVYLTSMSAGYKRLWDSTAQKAKKGEFQLAVNPGSCQMSDGLTKWKKAVQAADIVFLNKTEVQKLLQTDITSEKTLLRRFHELGCNVIIMTVGKKGAWGYDGDDLVHVKSLANNSSADSTGAGDSFASGMLSALAYNKDWKHALKWGIMNSGSVISKVGPQNGLLSKAELKKWLRKYHTIQPQIFS